RELGRRIGLHPNTVRFHVEQLIEARLVHTVTAPISGRGRPRVLYQAESDPTDEEEGGYRLLAQILASYLATVEQPKAVAESAGRAWGGYLAAKPQPYSGISGAEATTKIVELFGGLGFMPEAVAAGSDTRVLLHRCPFREVAQSHQDVVCAVHLGMLRGALAEMGAPLHATDLESFVEPNLCIAHLSGLAADGSGSGTRRRSPMRSRSSGSES
ncbi:MAG: helix-turn-helix transcriptional regulator, partial [Candidatus Dormibacteraceae bacterium]